MARHVRVMRPFAAAVAGLLLLVAGGCGSRGFVRPDGLSQPVADAAALWRQATASCSTLTAYQAQLHLSGRIDGQRVPGLLVGVIATRDDRIALEARLSGAALFVLGGSADAVTLTLTQPARVVTGRAEAMVEALVGLPWSPVRLLAVLSGCLAPDARAVDARRYAGGVTAVRLSGGDEAYLVERNGRPALRAGSVDGVMVEYGAAAAGLPAQIAIRTEPQRTPAVSLSIRVDVVVANPVLTPALFAVSVPTGAAPLSIEALRSSGPLGGR